MSYYETLNVSRTATVEEIKRSYKNLARQHHPDKGGDTNHFQKIQEAYETLSDDQKRAQYDEPPRHPHMHGFHMGGGNSFFDMFLNFGFQQMNINFNKPRQPLAHVIETVKVTLADAMKGITRSFIRALRSNCPTCVSMCNECRGQGAVLRNVVVNGMIRQPMQMGCQTCGGSGLSYAKKDECTCTHGKVLKAHECKVHIKPEELTPGKVEVRFPTLGNQAETFLQNTSDFVVNFEYALPANLAVMDKHVVYTPTVHFKDLLCGHELALPEECKAVMEDRLVSIPAFSVTPNYQLSIEDRGLFLTNSKRGNFVVKPTVDYSGMSEMKMNGEKLEVLRSLF